MIVMYAGNRNASSKNIGGFLPEPARTVSAGSYGLDVTLRSGRPAPYLHQKHTLCINMSTVDGILHNWDGCYEHCHVLSSTIHVCYEVQSYTPLTWAKLRKKSWLWASLRPGRRSSSWPLSSTHRRYACKKTQIIILVTKCVISKFIQLCTVTHTRQ